MFYFDGQTYELPKKTMALNDKIEAINNAKSTNEAYRKMLDFVVSGLGKEKVIELLGTDNIMDVDLTQLNILANAIVIGYDQLIYDQQIEHANKIAEAPAVRNIIEAGKSIQTISKFKK